MTAVQEIIVSPTKTWLFWDQEKRDYQHNVTTGQTTDRYTCTDVGQSGPYVLLCFGGNYAF